MLPRATAPLKAFATVFAGIVLGAAGWGLVALGPDQRAAARFDDASACSSEAAASGCWVDFPGVVTAAEFHSRGKGNNIWLLRVKKSPSDGRMYGGEVHFPGNGFDTIRPGDPARLRFYAGQLATVFVGETAYRTNANPDEQVKQDFGLIEAAAIAVVLVPGPVLILLIVATNRRRRLGG